MAAQRTSSLRAEIISIGTELLLGETIDTNSAYIASRLPSLGIDVYFQHTVGDNLVRLTDLLNSSLQNNDLVITTGGLGPTEDDLTREAIARVMDEEPRVDPELEIWLRDLFQKHGFDIFPERNIKQAWLIPSARAIGNERGSAPGWWTERDGKLIIALPGPPSEMTPMWDNDVEWRLKALNPGSVLVKRTLKTSGLGESFVDELLSPLMQSLNPSIGIYARADGVHARIAAKAATSEEAMRLISPVEEEARRILGSAVWGTDDDSIESIVGSMLAERGLSIGVMESCTGGLLSDTFTNIPGSSAYFKGGIVSYATEVKALMGVEPQIIDRYGVISSETAAAMAKVARERMQASIGIGITGVAGPASQDGSPVGDVHIAVAGGDLFPAESQLFRLGQSRDVIKRRAVQQAMLMLRRLLLEN